ncbi:hypothetical protein MHYP_G00139950 [Metynnis hypsauchen]
MPRFAIFLSFPDIERECGRERGIHEGEVDSPPGQQAGQGRGVTPEDDPLPHHFHSRVTPAITTATAGHVRPLRRKALVMNSKWPAPRRTTPNANKSCHVIMTGSREKTGSYNKAAGVTHLRRPFLIHHCLAGRTLRMVLSTVWATQPRGVECACVAKLLSPVETLLLWSEDTEFSLVSLFDPLAHPARP